MEVSFFEPAKPQTAKEAKTSENNVKNNTDEKFSDVIGNAISEAGMKTGITIEIALKAAAAEDEVKQGTKTNQAVLEGTLLTEMTAGETEAEQKLNADSGTEAEDKKGDEGETANALILFLPPVNQIDNSIKISRTPLGDLKGVDMKPENDLKAPANMPQEDITGFPIPEVTGFSLNTKTELSTADLSGEDKALKETGNSVLASEQAVELPEIKVENNSKKGTETEVKTKEFSTEPVEKKIAGAPENKDSETSFDQGENAATQAEQSVKMNEKAPEFSVSDTEIKSEPKTSDAMPKDAFSAVNNTNGEKTVTAVQPKSQAIHSNEVSTEVYEKFDKGLKMSLAQSGKEVKLSLHPEHLGELRIKMNVEENIVKAEIMVDNASVKSILEADSAKVKEIFTQNGMNLEKYTVEVNQQGFQMSDNRSSGNEWERAGNFKGQAAFNYGKEEAGIEPENIRQYGVNRSLQNGVDIFI
ncbi:MAG: flagellar hook-length control protein FliK [Deltaproteobacteria bacterium]|nr:flagellar hook-length control protein FliK [Deltaproteobacteria bacterium]